MRNNPSGSGAHFGVLSQWEPQVTVRAGSSFTGESRRQVPGHLQPISMQGALSRVQDALVRPK